VKRKNKHAGNPMNYSKAGVPNRQACKWHLGSVYNVLIRGFLATGLLGSLTGLLMPTFLSNTVKWQS
jgi:hypothetical protein